MNLAPFSQCNNIGYGPDYVTFSVAGGICRAGRKDSTTSAIEGGEFVFNMATWSLCEEVNITTSAADTGVDEAEPAVRKMLPSRLTKPLQVAQQPVHLECQFYQAITLPGNTIQKIMTRVLGKVVRIHIKNDALTEEGHIRDEDIPPAQKPSAP